MAVPKTGKFRMFNTTNDSSKFTIEGAVSSSISDYDSNDTDRFSGSAHLIGQSVIGSFDEDFSGTVESNKINISSSQQFRGYPIDAGRYNFTMKCALSASRTIPDPDPDPNPSGSIIDICSIAPGYNGFSSGCPITGSNGIGDTTWPVSSSYDIHTLHCSTDEYLELLINQNGQTDPPPTFTSMTLTGPGGSNTYTYCDLNATGSLYGTGTYVYRWDNNNCPDFTVGNQVTITFNTASVDYFTDCDPAVATNGYKFTAPYIDHQIVCDDICSFTRYFHTDDVSSTNPVSVGDVVYTDSEGRNEFNGLAKYHGIVTSSALTTIPDVIARISSDGTVTEVLGCTQTAPYEPPLDSTTRDCNATTTSYSGNSGIIINATAGFNAGEYDVQPIGGTSETSQAFLWSSYERPNKFTLYDSSTTFANPIYTTGWVGASTYANAPGKDQWSVPLSTAHSGSASITWGSTTGRKVRVDYGYNNGTLNDVGVYSLICPTSLQPLNVAMGSSWSNVCSADLDDDIHYHFHSTSSDFASLYSDGINNIARVFDDNTGLIPVLKENGKYFAYTSSAGTRYAYTVLDNLFTNGGDDHNMGTIAYHQQCPGTEISSVRLMAAATDCDDSNTSAFSNNLYVNYNWAGFDVVGGKFKIDNDGLNLSNQIEIDLYNNDPSDSVVSEYSLDFSTATVSETAASNTFLVSDDSLKNPTGTKVLATVTAGTPATVSFTPCSTGGSFNGGGCTRIYVSAPFTSADFTGTDPSSTMCNPGSWSPYTSSINMQGTSVAVDDEFFVNTTCGGSIVTPEETYFTIYEPIAGTTHIIKFSEDYDNEIKEVFNCSSVTTAGDNNYYLSSPFTDYGDNCGQSYAVSNAVTSDAGTIATGLHDIVYDNGTRFNGANKYYIVKTSSQTAGGSVGDNHRFWQIDSNGVIQDVSLYTCGGSGGSE